ncbi:MAG: GNAT family N-acetyltransferase [Clostridia bacterium]|nr:GNAT family N-acetyltransferase [Clostridia bacterium]
MPFVRKYEEKDYKDVQYVCLHCEDGPEDPPTLQEFVLHTFCDYYIDHEPHNCFVLDDDNGKAVGYVICAEDYDTYKKIFDEEYLELTRPQGEELYNWAKTSTVLQAKYKDEYPAHLHIDLTPSYHRKGFGSQLIKALCRHLAQKGVKGVMLTVGDKNVNGINFYKKCGFTLLEHADTDVAFGIKTAEV